MESVEDIKRAKHVRKTRMKRRIDEMNQKIDDLLVDNIELFVNGEAAELREVCKKNKERLKPRAVK
jgi:hypothetical protein